MTKLDKLWGKLAGKAMDAGDVAFEAADSLGSEGCGCLVVVLTVLGFCIYQAIWGN